MYLRKAQKLYATSFVPYNMIRSLLHLHTIITFLMLALSAEAAGDQADAGLNTSKAKSVSCNNSSTRLASRSSEVIDRSVMHNILL